MKLNQTLMAVTITGALALAGNANASIVYNIDEVVTGATPTAGVGGIVGTITTDGFIGTLGTADIIAWNLTVTGNDGTFIDLVNGPSGAFVSNTSDSNINDLTADANNLYFDFSATDGGYLLFQTLPVDSGFYYASFGAFDSAVVFQGLSAVPLNTFANSWVNEPVSDSGPQTIASVPEPTTMLLGVLMLAPFGTSLLRKMRKKQAA